MNTNHFSYQAGYNFDGGHQRPTSRARAATNAIGQVTTTYIIGYFLSEAGYEIWEPVPPSQARRPRALPR